MLTPEAVAQRVTGLVLDCRTALLLIPPDALGHEGRLAFQLGLHGVDYHAWRVARLRPDERFLRLNSNRLVAELLDLSDGPHPLEGLLIYNLDLPVASFDTTERHAFWALLRDSFRKRRHGLMAVMPACATHLLPTSSELDVWQAAGRLAHHV